MEDRETPRIHKYGETNTTPIVMSTVRQVTSSSGLRKFQAACFLLNRGYKDKFGDPEADPKMAWKRSFLQKLLVSLLENSSNFRC